MENNLGYDFSYKNPQKDTPQEEKNPEVISVVPTKIEKKSIRKHYNKLGLAMIAQSFLVTGLFYLAFFLLADFMPEIYDEDGFYVVGTLEYALMSCLPAVSSIIMYFVYNKINKVDTSLDFRTDTFSVKFILVAIGVSFLFYQLGMYLQYGVLIVFDSFGLTDLSLEYSISDDIWTRLIDISTSFILAPIAEELFFRGVVLRGFSKYSVRFGIIFSALIFGFMHGNIFQAVMATLLGLVLGYITSRTGSIVPAIICHIAINGCVCISEVISYSNIELGDMSYSAISYIQLGIGLIVWMGLLRSGKLLIPIDGKYHKNRSWPLALSSFFVIATIIMYLYENFSGLSFYDTSEEIAEAMKIVTLNWS